MTQETGGTRLHRTWRLAVDAEVGTSCPIPLMPMAVVQNVQAQAITGALQADGIVLWGSMEWLEPRIERIRRVGLCFVPLLVVPFSCSARDVIRLLEGGADDVLAHPAEASTIVAKVHALNRRSSGKFLTSPSQVVLTPESCTVQVYSCVVQLRPTPFRLLAYLVAHQEEWVPKHRILRDVFGLTRDPGTSLIRVHIHAIRRSLGVHSVCVQDDPGRNRGYMFTLEGELHRDHPASGPRRVNA